MNRSRVEGLLASFPKLADSGTQHTTVEQDNVRFVYQPLDELYMVLITNRQSNILQDIDSLHLFAQVVTSICKKPDEREILRNAFELLSAFDELVTMGYRENLSMSQIKTFLEMESHEERIQEIIARNKELEASEERKRKAKQLEMQRKEAARSAAYGRGMPPKMPQYPTYTPPTRPAMNDTYDAYEAEKNKTFNKPLASRGKGMQLGKKSKTTDIYDRVKADMGTTEAEEAAPLVQPSAPSAPAVASSRPSLDSASPINVLIAEQISAKLSREGALKSFEVKGDLQLKISDPALTKLSLSLKANEGPLKAQFRTHPNVDKALFISSPSSISVALSTSTSMKGLTMSNLTLIGKNSLSSSVCASNSNEPEAFASSIAPIVHSSESPVTSYIESNEETAGSADEYGMVTTTSRKGDDVEVSSYSMVIV